ncbi:hypothetical protein GIB67_031490 [Kingdonia uniflora]|uniref:Tetratricopeptide repeat protein 1 n=1 Tax=Kingdonia uniflora TaxID=39325 RepID=A0A7J7MN44_9MAGN|nr:hypothetical protein GIB67_031490 [Kingdonia uniflora]
MVVIGEEETTGTRVQQATKENEGYETASDGEVEGEDCVALPKDESYEDALNDEEMKQRALTQANDAKSEGNKLFGAGQYEDALLQYELGLQVAPDMPSSVEVRSICHANRAICFSKLGKNEETIKECTKALELNPTYMKALIRRGEANEKLEHFEEAIAGTGFIAFPVSSVTWSYILIKTSIGVDHFLYLYFLFSFVDMKKILELDPSNDQARKTIRRLEPLAAEKREKMKEEMIGKLKEMGNSILGRFGMSVDNFKTVKDPNTGSYSVSFQR